MKNNKGISLITLIITIIVMIILAGTVIVTISNSNIMSRASEATFKNNVSLYKEELEMYIISKVIEDVEYDSSNLNADKDSGREIVDGVNVNLAGIQEVISAMKDADAEIFIIKNGNLMINDKEATSDQKEWAKAEGVGVNNTFGTNGNLEPGVASVNTPIIAAGLTPIIFNVDGTAKKVEETNSNWYAYIDQGEYLTDGKTSRWANAMSQDGSQWVWIPRYAYKINYTNPTNKSVASEIEVVFIDINNKDINGNDYTNGYNGYIIHPAFRDGTSNNFANGEWDSELSGIWIAKYEAGFSGVNGIKSNGESSITYSSTFSNILQKVEQNKTKITYPVFKPNAYSYDYITIGDSYALCKALTEKNNPYEFTENMNSHMLKNSEWGAAVYLTQSKYGRNGVEVSPNMIELNGEPEGIRNITGYAQQYEYTYNTENGMKASTTGNLYGIYDMSGGICERTACYINSTDANLMESGKKMVESVINNKSNKFVSVYNMPQEDDQATNYNMNSSRIGEAIWETSSAYQGCYSWFQDYSYFAFSDAVFLYRGGSPIHGEVGSGIFNFYATRGTSSSIAGFRAVLCINEL